MRRVERRELALLSRHRIVEPYCMGTSSLGWLRRDFGLSRMRRLGPARMLATNLNNPVKGIRARHGNNHARSTGRRQAGRRSEDGPVAFAGAVLKQMFTALVQIRRELYPSVLRWPDAPEITCSCPCGPHFARLDPPAFPARRGGRRPGIHASPCRQSREPVDVHHPRRRRLWAQRVPRRSRRLRQRHGRRLV